MHTYFILGAGRREPPLPCAEGADSASARRDVREMTVTGRQTGRGSLVGGTRLDAWVPGRSESPLRYFADGAVSE